MMGIYVYTRPILVRLPKRPLPILELSEVRYDPEGSEKSQSTLRLSIVLVYLNVLIHSSSLPFGSFGENCRPETDRHGRLCEG